MHVEDVFVQNRRLWVRPHKKGGKRHEIPFHYNLKHHLDGRTLRDDRKSPLSPTIVRGTKRLSETPLLHVNAFAMVRRRAAAAVPCWRTRAVRPTPSTDLAKRHIEAVIPGRSNRHVKIEHDWALYNQPDASSACSAISRSTAPLRTALINEQTAFSAWFSSPPPDNDSILSAPPGIIWLPPGRQIHDLCRIDRPARQH